MILDSDAFDICTRIKDIDRDYAINWNSRKKRYEVVRDVAGRMVVEIVIPYPTLDKRTLDLVHKTSIRYLYKHICLAERANRLTEERNLESAKYQIGYDLRLLLGQ